jgi:hypothetical protein
MRRRTDNLRRRRGAAILEFLLVLPFLAFLLTLIFFFGWARTNQQHVEAAARYVSWRDLHNGEAGADGSDHAYIHWGEPDEQDQRDEFLSDYRRRNVVEVTEDLLNERFFFGQARDIAIGRSAGPDDTIRDLVDAAGAISADAGDLANRSALTRWPHGHAATVRANFPPRLNVWKMFPGSIRWRHSRDGVGWRRRQASYLEPIRDQFLFTLDEVVETIAVEQLRTNLRRLYLRTW